MLSRISTLTYAIYLVDSNYLIQSCGFILQLLSVVSETTVMSLFESLCKPDPENINVQNWLINDIGFIETIHTEVDEYRCAVDTGIYDNQANLLVALLKLIKICAENPLFSKHVCNHAFVYSLNRNIGDYPQFIEDARWEALSAIFHPRTQEMLHGLFQSAVEIIKDPIKCRTRSSCACLSILTKMMQYDELMRPYIIKLQLAKTVFAIMIENCGHSILHNECRTFISGFFSYNNCAESDEEQAKFLIHQVMVNTQSKDCHLRASMKLLANKIIVAIAKKPKLVKAAREIPSFTPKFTTFLQKYDENINTYYGGACETNSDEAQSYGMMALKLFRCF